MRKCDTCKYRTRITYSGMSSLWGCFYIVFTGHRRGCPYEDCEKYEEGDPRSLLEEPYLGFKRRNEK